METLSGTVKTIIFRSEETGFTVLELTDESGDEITAVGEMPLAGVGERVELTGSGRNTRPMAASSGPLPAKPWPRPRSQP